MFAFVTGSFPAPIVVRVVITSGCFFSAFSIAAHIALVCSRELPGAAFTAMLNSPWSVFGKNSCSDEADQKETKEENSDGSEYDRLTMLKRPGYGFPIFLAENLEEVIEVVQSPSQKRAVVF